MYSRVVESLNHYRKRSSSNTELANVVQVRRHPSATGGDLLDEAAEGSGGSDTDDLNEDLNSPSAPPADDDQHLGSPLDLSNIVTLPVTMFPMDPPFMKFCCAGVAPPARYQDIDPDQLADTVRKSVGDSHIGLVIVDLPQRTTGERWDKLWSGKQINRMLKWVDVFIKRFDPVTQTYTLIMFCAAR